MSVTRIENESGKGQPGGINVQERISRKRAQHCLHSFRRKGWAQTHTNDGCFTRGCTVLLAQRREGIIWGKTAQELETHLVGKQSQGSGAVLQMHFCLLGQIEFLL